MPLLSISQVAREAGFRTSAIRYYEEIGILPPSERVSGQRRYDRTILHRLALIRRAQDVGFNLNEIRQLFFGFRKSTPVSARWNAIAETKLAELNVKIAQIQSMKDLLEKLRACCRCETIDECGAGILRSQTVANQPASGCRSGAIQMPPLAAQTPRGSRSQKPTPHPLALPSAK